jgi:hypothetical protein
MEYKSIGDILGRIILMDIPYLEDYNANNNMLFPVKIIEKNRKKH